MNVDIEIETPLQDDVRSLIGELNDAMNALEPETPEEFKFRMTADEMAEPRTTVWVARVDGRVVGCGALLRHADGLGEVKRMYVRPDTQGQGIAGKVLSHIEKRAEDEGIARLALETGVSYLAARRVYERAGFTVRGPFADYPDNPFSVFYEKLFAAHAAA